jgi:hypothetical protein
MMKSPYQVDHGPYKISFASATRLSRAFGTRGFPRLHHLWSSGPPTYFGGQASHDYSWFGFIGNIFIIFLAISMPKGTRFVNSLIFKDLLKN